MALRDKGLTVVQVDLKTHRRLKEIAEHYDMPVYTLLEIILDVGLQKMEIKLKGDIKPKDAIMNNLIHTEPIAHVQPNKRRFHHIVDLLEAPKTGTIIHTLCGKKFEFEPMAQAEINEVNDWTAFIWNDKRVCQECANNNEDTNLDSDLSIIYTVEWGERKKYEIARER